MQEFVLKTAPTAEAASANAGNKTMTASAAIQRLCDWARAQLGYHEGSNNWNKYAETPGLSEMYGWTPQNQPWCDVFVDAGFIECFGLPLACALTYQPMGAGSALCRQSAQYYRERGAFTTTPQEGDQIFFYSGGDINHTGIVIAVNGGTVVTVEGNSSDAVSQRTYSLGAGHIAGYGRPNWAALDGQTVPDAPDVKPVKRSILKKGMSGEDVLELQQALKDLGYYKGYVDGEYGMGTFTAVAKFQEAHGLEIDGEAGPVTLSVIESVRETETDKEAESSEKDPVELTADLLLTYLRSSEFQEGFREYVKNSLAAD